MNPCRFATFHSLAYLLPLVFWLSAQLELNGWATLQVQSHFRQSVLITICAQSIGMSLLFFKAGENSLAGEISAFLLMLLFPLPLLTLSWLTGSLEFRNLIYLVALVALTGLLAFGIRRILLASLSSPQVREPMIGAFQIGLLMLLWNYRHLWLNWSGL